MQVRAEADIISLPGVELSAENRELSSLRDRIKELREKYDSVTLSRDIKTLQEASRIQNLKSGIREVLLKELSRRKVIKQIIDGDFN